MTPKSAPTEDDISRLGKDLAPLLLRWFDRNKRPMPWRETRDPYAIWLSETMLQQTQVATVIPYYHRFLARLPTVQALAAAPLEVVLSLWAGLGYYRRAKHLHAAAKMLVERFGGKVPRTVSQLLELPGVGRYTAGAVASIAFGESAAVLDGNVMRVLTRLGAIEEDISAPKVQKKLWVMAERLVPTDRPGDFNQGLMELGATVCTPAAPRCHVCPLRLACASLALGRTHAIPRRRSAAPPPVIRKVAVVISRRASGAGTGESGREVLVVQRPEGVVWESMWEFPALEVAENIWSSITGLGATEGKIARSTCDSCFNCLAQIADEVKQRLGIRVTLDPWHRVVGHQLTHRTMDYRVLRGRGPVKACDVRLPACDGGRYQAYRWVRWSEAAAAGIPMGRLTLKIAEAAGIGEHLAAPER